MSAIPQAAPSLTIEKAFKFHFKKDELGNKRETVNLKFGVPTDAAVIDILTRAAATYPDDEAGKKAKEAAKKELELLLSVMEDVVVIQAREQVNSDVKITQETLKANELSWAYIANLPPSDRRGGGISKETWEAFTKDYLAVVPSVTGKSVDQVGNAAKLLVGRFQECKFKKEVVTFLKSQLGQWFAATTNAEEFADVFEFLNNKADAIIKGHDVDLSANL
jgi:hypothetical protein